MTSNNPLSSRETDVRTFVSPIVAFYAGQRPDLRGRWLHELWRWDDNQLEMVHNYIQVLFPNKVPSMFNSWAPLLDQGTIDAFFVDGQLRKNLSTSFERMLKFYGLQYDSESGRVERGANFSRQAYNWLNPYNHNYLRITRILKCLMTLGLPDQARAFFACLEEIYAEYAPVIGAETLSYWQDAISAEQDE